MSPRVKRVRRHRQKNALPFARIGVLSIAILTGLGFGLLCLKYGPRAFSSWRESQSLKRATEMLQKQNFAEASREAHHALQTHPDSLPAFLILAEASEKQNLPETVAWRAQIARLQPQSLDALLNLASAALRFGQLDTARKALDAVPPGDRDRAAFHVVAGWLARAQGNDADVEEHFAAAVEKEPSNELYQFNLAVLRIRSADAETASDARSTLERLSKVVRFRTGSLRALLTDAIARKDLSRADNLAQDLQMSQQVTFSDDLLCLDFYRQLDQAKFTSLLERVKPLAARNPGDLAALMDWMNRNGLASEVLKWTDKLPAEQTTNPPAAITVAAAFAETKNWSRLKRWTRSGSWHDAEFMRLAYQAYASRQSRQSAADAESDSLWHAAEKATNDQPEKEATLARLAARWNLNSEAEQLWQRVSKNAPMRREALDALYKIYRANNDLSNLYKTAQRLHEASPHEPTAAANYARLALILDQNAADGHRVAKEAYDAARNDVNCVMTYAFSLYGLGRTAEAVRVMDELPTEALEDPHAAVYAAVFLVDNNELDAARAYADIAKDGPIFMEEKKLLEEALQKLRAVPVATPAPSASPASVKTENR